MNREKKRINELEMYAGRNKTWKLDRTLLEYEY